MNPDYVSPDGTVRLYCADCRDVLPGLDGMDLILTDPPYGISHRCDYASANKDRVTTCRSWGDVIGDSEAFDPAPLLSLNLPTILWGANHFADKLPPSGGWLVWDKMRPDDLDQATCELAWTNCVKGVRRLAHLWNGCMKASQHGEGNHPTEKPVALMSWALTLRWTKDFASVLDPYMGSSPVGVACVALGKNYVGIELDPTHFATSVRRIERAFDARRQGDLFRVES